ncbi:MAG: rhomboid family intramembrane serine protease [Sedimentisphaerales bacterium]|nr:rhomboid family intramembrane serine protease [Sedimentisphaerales bacterium]
MILPIRTNIRPRRTPYANYALIIINVIIFLFTFLPHVNPYTGALEPLRPAARKFMLNPQNIQLFQLVSYAFLHGGIWHIIGNMYFLYIFGSNVNDKLGHIGYVCFYLAGAIASGLGHTLMNNIPVLGASGAVAAVTGAYLALFPQTLITVFYWFFIFGTMDIPALYLIVFKMIFIDNIIARYVPNDVAFDAHLAGYAFGIAASLVLLATGLLSANSFDLWAMIKQWNRRRRYRDTVSTGYDPFTAAQAKHIKVKEVKKTDKQRQHDEKIRQLRHQISQRCAQHNLPAAAQLYLELIDIDTTQILPRQYLLDIANQLASENRHPEAAQAYEDFISHYGNYEYIEQVQLMLGIIYSRYLQQAEPAIKHLKAAAGKLSDPAQLKMCSDELTVLRQ